MTCRTARKRSCSYTVTSDPGAARGEGAQRERRIEVFERGEDARWSFTEALDTGSVALRCFGGSLAVEDVYEGVNLEPASNPQSA